MYITDYSIKALRLGIIHTRGDIMSQVVFVIGGSSGIGAATVTMLLNQNYIVYQGSRTFHPDKRVHNLIVDVTNPDTIKEAVDTINQDNKRIDILIYCAGFSMAAPVELVERTDYQYLFDVNVFGLIEVVQATLPLMKKTGGKIIQVGSTASYLPIPYDGYYSASKVALSMLGLEFHNQLKKLGIQVTSIHPGGTKTPFTKKRKVYDRITSDYKDMDKAVQALASIEQGGMEAERVAHIICKTIKKSRMPLEVICGFTNKIACVLTRFIPKRCTLYFVRRKFGIK